MAIVATFIMISLRITLLVDTMGPAWTLVPALIVLAIVARLGWRLISRYRQRVLGDEGAAGAWTMADLERMRDSGQISEQEFKILRDQTMRGFMNPQRSDRPGKSTS